MTNAGERPREQRRPAALVLAGGGALGAYEVGVLRYLVDELGDAASAAPGAGFDIYAGTSVGALNATFLAATGDRLPRAIDELTRFWKSLTMDRVLRFRRRELGFMVRMVMGGRSRTSPPHPPAQRPPPAPHPPPPGLFDTSQMRRHIRALIPWRRLQQRLASGALRGIALCATEVCTGRSVVFYQTGPGTTFRQGSDPLKHALRVEIDVDHVMASGAIPFLFPAVQWHGTCYTDGALRQNTPLNPALRMGADRVLVVSLSQEPARARTLARMGCRRNPLPGSLFMLGRTVMVFMSQTLDYELSRIQMYNRLITAATEAYGPGFLELLNRVLGEPRNATYRPVRTAHVRPAESLNLLALEALRAAPRELRLPGLTGEVARRVMASTAIAESELLGFLMFTPTYIRMLLELGYQDARRQREQLLGLFTG